MSEHDPIVISPKSDSDDIVLPFIIERSGIHGRLVRLGPTANSILSRHAYPEPVKRLLGEFLSLGAALATTLKYDGIFTLQAKGDGPVPLMVADVTSDGDVRGYAQVTGSLPSDDEIAQAPVPRLFGAGYLAFTVDQPGTEDRYQGIVELQGQTLSDCVHHYFQQSEQFSAVMRLSAGRDSHGSWRAGSLMLRRLPDEQGADEPDEDDWRRAVVLLGSATAGELIDAQLPANDLLYRLFHEDGVRVFRTKPLAAGCRCSRERTLTILRGFDSKEREELKVDGVITMTCEFCNTAYTFSDSDLA